jgi:hypothetical protein
MASWPTNWKHRALEAAGIPATGKAMRVLSAWARSTPTDPWTNNPLGLPAVPFRTASVPGTEYGAFRSATYFYAAFQKWSQTTAGKAVVAELLSDAGHGPVWRAIASAGLPGSKTETDYPAGVLDLAEEAYRAAAGVTGWAERKTSGKSKAAPDVHEAMKAQARSVTGAVAAFNDSRTAVRFLLRRHASNG